jgi:hypothetical protein
MRAADLETVTMPSQVNRRQEDLAAPLAQEAVDSVADRAAVSAAGGAVAEELGARVDAGLRMERRELMRYGARSA